MATSRNREAKVIIDERSKTPGRHLFQGLSVLAGRSDFRGDPASGKPNSTDGIFAGTLCLVFLPDLLLRLLCDRTLRGLGIPIFGVIRFRKVSAAVSNAVKHGPLIVGAVSMDYHHASSGRSPAAEEFYLQVITET